MRSPSTVAPSSREPRAPGRDARRFLRFADFEVDRSTRELQRSGEQVPIQEKPLRLLEALLLADGDVVTRDELRRSLWPDGTFVEYEAGIHTAVRKLRDALGDSARDPRWIETLPGVGYRFVGEQAPIRPATRFSPTRLASTRLAPTRTLGALTLPRWLVLATGLVGTALVVFLASSAALDEHLGQPAPQRVASIPLPSNPAARQRFLEGRFLKERQTAEELEKAGRFFSEVVALEPDFAAGHAELAWVLARRELLGSSRCSDCWLRARRAVDRALEIDDRQSVALLADGMIALFHDWDRERARDSIERVLEITPESAEAHLALATWLSAVGQPTRAVAAVRRAVELDPASHLTRSDAGFFLLAAGRPVEAIDECQRVLALDPDFLPARGCLLQANERLGRFDEAVEQARVLMEVAGASADDLALLESGGLRQLRLYRNWALERATAQASPPPVGLAAGYAAAGRPDLAFDWLERALESHDPQLALLMTYVAFEPLRADPRFETVVRRVGLVRSNRASSDPS